MNPRLVVALLGLGAGGCVGSTGGDIVTFTAAAAGPADTRAGQPLDFVSGRGFHVLLTRATLHVGAIYLNQSLPISGAQATSCILPGTYVAQVRAGLDVDMLSPDLQPFPEAGEGTTTAAQAGEVWLTGRDVNAADDATPILSVAGTADKDGQAYPFTGEIKIGKNRSVPSTDPSQPGTNPVCKQRIVSPIPADVTPRLAGQLVLRLDPRALFVNVDFSALKQVAANPPSYAFVDAAADQPSISLYQALRSTAAYQFEWSGAN
jgi:hypothetical protein